MTAELQLETPKPCPISPWSTRKRGRAPIIYGLIAALLRSVPISRAWSRHLAELEVDDRGDELEQGAAGVAAGGAPRCRWRRSTTSTTRLFIGLGRGELVPYGVLVPHRLSHGKAPRRAAGATCELLGFDRQQDVHEPEDHVAALCEVMSMLIADSMTDMPASARFFDKHLGCWAGSFFRRHGAVRNRPCSTAPWRRWVRRSCNLEQRYLTLEI